MTTLAQPAAEIQTRKRFEVIGYDEIDVDLIEPNPYNPRPKFQLEDDDKRLEELGTSIKIDGQHQPAFVYELGDKPGHYRLVQGESRWRGCRIARVPKLRCFIIATPSSIAEEREWLGNEEAFKRPWQTFFRLRYCVDLAKDLGVPVVSAEIASKTGETLAQLRVAERVFKLEPEIQAHVANYEELMYRQQITGERGSKTSRITGQMSRSGIIAAEFPVSKAAIVYDIFFALRTYDPHLVKDYDDLELQRRIAAKVSRASLEDASKLYTQIRQGGKNPPAILVSYLADFIGNDTIDIKTTLRQTGGANVQLVAKFTKSATTLAQLASRMKDLIDQLGTDPDELVKAQMAALKLQTAATKLESALDHRIADLRKKMPQ